MNMSVSAASQQVALRASAPPPPQSSAVQSDGDNDGDHGKGGVEPVKRATAALAGNGLTTRSAIVQAMMGSVPIA